MKPKFEWVMKIAVISVSHAPDRDWKPEHTFHFSCPDEEVALIVLIEDLDPEEPEWLHEIAKALLAEGHAWVRFDVDGPVIEGLPTFKWD